MGDVSKDASPFLRQASCGEKRMLENVSSMFDGYSEMIAFKIGKKASYTLAMKEFQERCGHYFTEMTGYTSESDEKDKAADEIAVTFVNAVKERFSGKHGPGKGKISGRKRLDLSFFMVYYVFPAILLTGHPDAELIAQHLQEEWNKEMEQNLTYTDYDTIRGAFQEKLFGLIPIRDKSED